jgi:zinc transport system substrate-binding protein
MRMILIISCVLSVLLPASASAGRSKAVVAAFYPVAYAAQQIGGSTVEVTNLTPAGAEPHDLELRASDVIKVAKADLVLYLGEGFQPAVAKAVTSTHAHAIDLLANQSLAAGKNEEGKQALDPHVWLDPNLYAKMATEIGRALDDPKATSAFVARLSALDRAYQQGLAHCRRTTIVTSHAAFGYLSRRYHLHQLALQGMSPEAEPTPRALEHLIEQVRKTKATTVFFETLVSPKLAQTVARESGAKTAVLDPIEGITPNAAQHGATYFTVMKSNLATLRGALGCL